MMQVKAPGSMLEAEPTRYHANPMRARLLATSALTLLLTVVLVAPVMAEPNNGEGLVGETDDKIITFFCLGVVVFFFLVVCLGSFLQGRLEKRKNARKAAALKQRTGW